jgi:DNA-binding LacI/PurR family transcriptional regulator
LHILKTAERVPVILTNHTVIGKNIYCILADEAGGAELAVQHLIDSGRDKIAYINGHFNAVFVSNDLMAVGVMKKLIGEGIRIPHDVAVVGYDDIQLCRYLTPSLSSVTQEVAEIGSMAVQLLIDVLKGNEVQKITYLPPRLMIRKSSN